MQRGTCIKESHTSSKNVCVGKKVQIIISEIQKFFTTKNRSSNQDYKRYVQRNKPKTTPKKSDCPFSPNVER